MPDTTSLGQEMRVALFGRERDQSLRLLLNSLHIPDVVVKAGSLSHREGDAFGMTQELRVDERLPNE
jgi:hypothetical protein